MDLPPRGSVPSTPPRSTFSEDTGSAIFFGSLFRWIRPLLWSGAKAVGRETLRTGGKILYAIAERDDVSAGDIVYKHVTESAQNLISKLRGRECKRALETGGKKWGPRGPKPQKIKRARKIIKNDFFS